MKEVDIGNESFADMINNDSYYVDKTSFIKSVFKKGVGKVMLITRPRRFGKTLTMNTFYEFLRLNPKDPNNSEDTSYQESLFKNTKIYEDKDFCQENMGKFPVIFITLKDGAGDTYELAYRQLSEVICNLIRNNFMYLLSSDKLDDSAKVTLSKLGNLDYFTQGRISKFINNQIVLDDIVDDQDTVKRNLQSSLLFLTECLTKHHGVNPIILIDEYDVPISKAAHYGYYNKIIPLISVFFSKTLKYNLLIKKAVLTGCLRAATESIFTGINNLNICSVLDTDNPEMSKGIGFTKEETLEVLTYYKLDKYHDLVTENYDGYYFGREHMYCPWDVMNFCSKNYRNVGEYEDEIVAANYWINTSGNDVIEEYMGYITSENIDQMQTLVNMEPITTLIRPSLCYGDLHSHNIQDFWTLLLYTGYLTFNPKYKGEKKNEYQLRIPNQEIKDCFDEKINQFYANDKDYRENCVKLAKGLFNGDSAAVEENINKLAGKYVSIRDFTTKAAKENYYHGFLNGVLADSSSLIEQQESNFESGNGYIDILLKSRINKALAIIELKQNNNEKQSKVLKAEEAIEQIKENNYAGEFLSNPDISDIYIYGICFYQKECTVVVEKLK